MKRITYITIIISVLLVNLYAQKPSLRQMEKLSRGVVAVVQPDSKVFISWRMFGTDPENIAFNLYRQTDSEKAVKLNEKPIDDVTFFIDDKADLKKNQYIFCPRRSEQKRKGN